MAADGRSAAKSRELSGIDLHEASCPRIDSGEA